MPTTPQQFVHGLTIALALSLPSSHSWCDSPAVSPGLTARLEAVPGWPQKPAQIAWGAVPGVVVDGQDRVCVFNRIQPAVQVYNTEGALLTAWPLAAPDAKGAHGIRIDGQGNFWLTDFRRHVVQKYDPDGKLLLTLGEPGRRGSDASHFDGPTDIAILPDGDVFITDGYGNRRVVHFDRHGKYVKHWGEEGDGPGQFILPHAIVADSQQRLYVADRNGGRIKVFDREGKSLAVWDHLFIPWSLAITASDEVWACGSSRVPHPQGTGWMIAPPPDQFVMKFNREGAVLLRAPLPMIATPPGNPGEVDWVHNIGVDSRSDVYLSDIEGKRAQKFRLRLPE